MTLSDRIKGLTKNVWSKKSPTKTVTESPAPAPKVETKTVTASPAPAPRIEPMFEPKQPTPQAKIDSIKLQSAHDAYLTKTKAEAKARTAQLEADIEASKASKTPVGFHNAFVDKQLLELEERHAKERELAYRRNKRASAPAVKPQMSLWHLPNQEYMVGYTPEDGAIIMSTRKHLAGLIFRIQNRKQVMTKADEAAATNNFSVDLVNGKGLVSQPSTFNNITLDEFKALLAAKPKWSVISTAYAMTPADTYFTNDLNSRMKKETATVVF